MKVETTVGKVKFEISLDKPTYTVTAAEMSFLLRNASYRMLPFFGDIAEASRKDGLKEPFPVASAEMMDAIKELTAKEDKKNAAQIMQEKLARFEALVASGVLLPSGLPNPDYVAPSETTEETES